MSKPKPMAIAASRENCRPARGLRDSKADSNGAPKPIRMPSHNPKVAIGVVMISNAMELGKTISEKLCSAV